MGEKALQEWWTGFQGAKTIPLNDFREKRKKEGEDSPREKAKTGTCGKERPLGGRCEIRPAQEKRGEENERESHKRSAHMGRTKSLISELYGVTARTAL